MGGGGLSERLRLHQARHTYASFMIAAGVNAKALCSYMGHSSIKVTFDLYGHLMPGAEAEAASLLDTYLALLGHPKGRRRDGCTDGRFQARAVNCAPADSAQPPC